MSYEQSRLPSELVLRDDLLTAVAAYRALTFRGGLDITPETEASASVSSLLEERRYRFHRRIERNSKAAQEAKRVHGLRCQACAMSFGETYGTLGQGYIEAHHLRPISSLEEGVPVMYDIKNDFAVLCSNCHRMIHRTENAADLEGFRRSLRL
jgi:5-methylcytosine-specific restriction protein A